MFIALTGSFATAVYFILLARAARESDAFDSTQALISTHLIGALLTSAAALYAPSASLDMTRIDMHVLSLVALSTLPLVLSRKLYLYAYGRIDVAYVTIFSPLTPIYAIIFGIVLYQIWPSPAEVAGILTIILAIYILFATPGNAARSLAMPKHMSLPVICAFASTIPTAFAALAQKDALAFFHPLVLAAIIQWGVCICLLVYYAATTNAPLKRHYFLRRDFMLAGLLFGVSNIAFHFILLEEQASVTLALQRMSSIFQIFLAHLWLKQQRHALRKILCGFLAFAGFMLLIYT